MEEVFLKSVTGEVDYFLPRRFFEELGTVVPTEDLPRARKIFDDIVFSPHSREYITNGAEMMLTATQKKGYGLILLSYGDPEFKEQLFASLGLKRFFLSDRMLVTARPKVETLRSLALLGTVVIIDDVLPELETLTAQAMQQSAEVHGLLYDPAMLNSVETLPKNITCISALAEVADLIP